MNEEPWSGELNLRIYVFPLFSCWRIAHSAGFKLLLHLWALKAALMLSDIVDLNREPGKVNKLEMQTQYFNPLCLQSLIHSRHDSKKLKLKWSVWTLTVMSYLKNIHLKKLANHTTGRDEKGQGCVHWLSAIGHQCACHFMWCGRRLENFDSQRPTVLRIQDIQFLL